MLSPLANMNDMVIGSQAQPFAIGQIRYLYELPKTNSVSTASRSW